MDKRQRKAARAICADCDSRVRCLELGLRPIREGYEVPEGTWGGFDKAERAKMRDLILTVQTEEGRHPSGNT